MISLAPQQQAAADDALDWFLNSDEQVFRIFGYAGTGKTTLAKFIEQALPARTRVRYGAYTGKAAYVLTQKGCPASTLHQLIYKVIPDSDPVKFTLNYDESPLLKTDLLNIDEVSMVNEDVGKDLLSFGCKILVLGDPAQLPPVSGAGFFTEAQPNAMLTEIHRQAEDNPIIQMATKVRLGQQLPIGTYGESSVQFKMVPELCLESDQLIVGRNKTRKAYNKAFRRNLGFGDARGEGLPEVGDKIICLRNNHNVGLLNGSIWFVERALLVEEGTLLELDLRSEDGSVMLEDVPAHPEYFLDGSVDRHHEHHANSFDYGYAITCHKSQGSQWDNVVIINESGIFGADRHRWLYTAITRAAKKVTIFLRG